MKNNIKICFTIRKKLNIHVAENKQEQFVCKVNNDILKVLVYYTFRSTPLCLTGKVNENDRIEIVLMRHRIELWINGHLTDEEWPAGERLLNETLLSANCNIDIELYTESKKSKPAVIGTFQDAEGWKPDENVFVGDCMPYVNDGRYHVLYLKDRHHHQSKWQLGAHQWNHISTADFLTWEIHPAAVEITDPSEGSICTGSWIKSDSTQYLFYTIRTTDGSPAPICRSISTDGYHFEKDISFLFRLSDAYTAHTARDPKVIRAADGTYHMIVTTSLAAEKKGCLAHLKSNDLRIWTETKPIYISNASTEPECPDCIEYNGKKYLIFSINGLARYCLLNDNFECISPEYEIPNMQVPKGAVWKDKIIFTGFKPSKSYANVLTFKKAVSATDDFILKFSPFYE